MKYEIKISWYVLDYIFDQSIVLCNSKEHAYSILYWLICKISNYYEIDYNCVELYNKKRLIGKIAIIEYLDKRNKKYGPFLKHLIVLGKPKRKRIKEIKNK